MGGRVGVTMWAGDAGVKQLHMCNTLLHARAQNWALLWGRCTPAIAGPRHLQAAAKAAEDGQGVRTGSTALARKAAAGQYRMLAVSGMCQHWGDDGCMARPYCP